MTSEQQEYRAGVDRFLNEVLAEFETEAESFIRPNNAEAMRMQFHAGCAHLIRMELDRIATALETLVEHDKQRVVALDQVRAAVEEVANAS